MQSWETGMSGSKQHYIPQFILRSFGKKGSGKAFKVNVYSRGGRVYITSTEGVGAERFFYSKLSADPATVTLDDKITLYEAELLQDYRTLCDGESGPEVNAEVSARFISHLLIRIAHTREALASAFEELFKEAAPLFLNRESARRIFGLDLDSPNEILSREIRRMFTEYADEHQIPIITRGSIYPQFEYAAFKKMKEDFDTNFANYRPAVNTFFGRLLGRIGEIVKNAHNRALERTLMAEGRAEALRNFKWKVINCGSGLILPDCVAVGLSRNQKWQALMYVGGEELTHVYMPITPQKILIGSSDGNFDISHDILIQEFAACSWDYFVAIEQDVSLRNAQNQIGRHTRESINMAIKNVVSDYSR